MTKVRYSTEVLVKNGRIRHSKPLGLENVRDDQRSAIELIKPILNTYLRRKTRENPVLDDSTILVKCKYLETSLGLTVEFKIQSVQSVGQASSS